MSETDQPTIADAKQIARKYGKQGVILLHFDFTAGAFGYVSYGEDAALCDRVKRIATRVFDAIKSGRIDTSIRNKVV